MPLADPAAWVSQQELSGLNTARPPDYILAAMQQSGLADAQGNIDPRYRWDPSSMSLVENTYGGGSLGFGDVPDPSLGTNVVYDGQTYHFGEGVNPYIAFPGENYDAGLTPNSGLFLSGDPNEIAAYSDSRRDRDWQGIARVGAVVGGGAALGAMPWGQAGTTPAGAGGATTYPLATGGPVTATPLAGGAAAGTAAPAGIVGPGAALGGMGSMPAVGGAAGAGAAAAGGAASTIPSWIGNYLIPGINSGLGYIAADRATDAETAGLQAGIDEQRRQFDLTREDLAPWLTAGRNALTSLQDPNAFTASPGYEWMRNEGQRDIGNSFAARGGAASGNALRALSEFNSGLASQDYNNWWNRQAGLAGVGQNTAVNLGNFGANTAGNIGNFLAGQGASRASGVLGKYTALGTGANEALYNYLYKRRAA